MKTAYMTDKGKRRKNNEDFLLVDEQNQIFILADGVGGNNAGEIASNMAVNESYTYLKDKLIQADSEKEMYHLMAEAMFQAHDVIKEKSKADPALIGMGTTLIEAVFKGEIAYVCHVGDSRVYHIREDMKQITRDHTLGDYLVEHYSVSKSQIPSPNWHALTQAVGASDELIPELNSIEMESDDIILICSDGLTDMLRDSEIYEIVRKYKHDLNQLADMLIKSANHNGGEDNITLILLKWDHE